MIWKSFEENNFDWQKFNWSSVIQTKKEPPREGWFFSKLQHNGLSAQDKSALTSCELEPSCRQLPSS
jgi:hypothetical protein